MKKLLLSIFVLGAIALVAIIHDMNMKTRFPDPLGVTVAIQDDETGQGTEFWRGLLADQTGKCFYQPASWKSMTKMEEVDCSVKTPPTDPDHPTVLVHFVIKEAGVSTQIDRTLPVWDKKPDPIWWLSLDDHFKTVAYKCGTVISM